MNSRHIQLAPAAFGLAVALLASTAAESRDFYAQVEIGRTSIDEAVDLDGLVFRLDESTSSHRIALGYEWNPWFSMEAAYNDFGSVSGDLHVATIDADADGHEFGLVFRWPLGERFSVTGRVGYLWWDAETRVTTVGASDSGEDGFAGIGAEFHANERVAITLGWNHYKLDDLEVDQASVGLRLSFGAGNKKD